MGWWKVKMGGVVEGEDGWGGVRLRWVGWWEVGWVGWWKVKMGGVVEGEDGWGGGR